VLSALADHLWQSIGCLLPAALCVSLARRNSAAVRLWIWRLAALKFAVPFAILAWFGRAFDLSTLRPDSGAPPALLAAVEASAPFASPVQAAGLAGVASLSACLVLLAVTGVCGAAIRRQLAVERALASDEDNRIARDPDDVKPGLGLWRGALFTLVAMWVVTIPLMAGAVEGTEWRRALIRENARALSAAKIDMQPAKPGLGTRVRVHADANGVRIRNVTLQQLSGLAYGISIYAVWAHHKVYEEDRATDWFAGQRFDLYAPGRIRDPENFDAYSLRVPVTRMLAERYGVELYLNQKCQPPCGVYNVPIPEEP
jgi:hypothetical protein